MTTGGAVTLGAGSSLSIANTSSMTTGGDLNTSGAVSLNGSDTLTIGGNLVVNSGGSYIENSNDTGRATGLTSKGTFELLGGSTFTLTGPWASLTNTGELTSGNYEFEGNSKFQYNNPVINTIVTIDHGVSLEIGDTSLITPDGTTDALTTLAVNNGTLELEYGYALNLVGGLTNGGNLYVGNSYYASPGTAGSLTVNGDFINNAGALVQVAGGFDYEAGGTMTTTGNFTNAAGATVEVNGGYVYAGGQLTVGGNFNNAGSMSIGGGYYSDNASVSVGGTFTNSGSLVLGENAEGSSYPGGFLSTLGFSNSGYTEVDPGAEILVGANGWSDITAGSLGNGGSYVIEGLLEAPNATITDIQNGVSLEMVDAGLITPDGTTNGLANLTSNEGALTFYDASLNTTPIGGTFTNSGAFTMNGSSVANTVTVNGNFINNDGGTVTVGSYGNSYNKTLSVTGDFTNGNGTSGILSIGGGYYYSSYAGDVVNVGGNFTNNPGATVTVGAGYYQGTGGLLTTAGNFTNAGTVQIDGNGGEFASNEAQVTVGGNFNNSGTLHLTAGSYNYSSGNDGGFLTTLGFTNTGTAEIDGGNGTGTGAEILVTGPAGSFTNVDSSGNFNAGTYIVEGGILSYTGSAITSIGVTSPTNLEYGDGAVITNDGVHDALTALNTIGSMGTLTLDNGQVLGLTDTGGLTNDGTLTLSGAASLTTAGAMTNSGTLNINQSNSSTPTSLTVNGDLTNSGPITIQGNTNSYDVPGGTLTVNGNVINQVGGAITVGGGGYYTNDGALMTTTGNFTNSGMVEIDGAQGWYSPGRMTVGGNFDNALGGTLHLTTGNAYSGFLQTAGFSNEGTVNLDEAAEISVTGTGTVSNSGILNINSNGSSYTGLLTMAGNFTNSGTATINPGGEIQVLGNAGDTNSGTLTAGALYTTAGNFTNSGTATINPGGEIQVLGNAGDTNTGTITLVGQPSTSVPQAVYTTNGSFTNAVGGVVTVQSSWSNGNQFTTGGGFTNNGTLEVYGGQYWGNAPGQVHVGGNFSNTGTMDLDVGYYGGNSYGGQLLVAGNWSDLSPSGELSGGGTFNIGGLFQYNGPSGVTSIDSGINLTFSSSGEIENGSTNALAGLGANAGNLEFDETNETFTPAGGTFTNSGTLTLGGTSGETITINGTLSNTGTVSLTGPNVTLNDDMNNSGAVTLSGVGDIQNVTGNYNNNSLGTLTFSGSNGQVNVASGNAFNNASGATVTMAGTNDTITAGTFNNAGSVTIGPSEIITMTTAAGYSQTAGTTQGSGRINGNVTISGGTIFAGSATNPGMLTINGNYTQNGTGVFNEVIGSGSSNGLLDIINGSITLGSGTGTTLTINLLNNYDPINGTSFTIMDGSLASGSFNISDPTFDNGNQKWVLSYNPALDDIVLTAASNISGTILATWTTSSGDWTTATQWGCSPGPSTCVPNNFSGTVYNTSLDSPGYTLTLPTGNSITVDTMTLTAGTLSIQSGATLNLANQPGGITDIPATAGLDVGGTFTAGANSALAGLTSVEGTLELFNGQSLMITPGGSPATLTNSGYLDIWNGTSVTVNGNLNNSYSLNTGYYGSGGNTLDITGTLTNSDQFYVYGSGDVATVGALNNSGEVYVNTGATLNVTSGITDVQAGSSIYAYGTINGLGGLTSVEGYLGLDNGQSISVTPGAGTLTLASSGRIDLHSGTDLTVNGTVSNAGNLYLYDSGTMANLTTLTMTSTGTTYIGAGTTMNLTNGITDVPGTLVVYGTINSGGTSALTGLTSVEGVVGLYNGQSLTITPGGSPATLTNSGYFNIADGTSVTVNGNVNTSYFLNTGYYGSGGNTLDITGTLTNTDSFYVYGSGDVATVGALNNSGTVYVNTGATLNLTQGITDVQAGSSIYDYGTINGLGGLTSVEGYLDLDNGQSISVTPGGGVLTLASTGEIDVYYGTGLTVNGTVNNAGYLYLYGTGTTATFTGLTNTGRTYIGTGTTLNLTNGITDVPGALTVYGTINSGGGSALAGLTSVEGTLYLANGQTLSITPGGSPATLTNSGNLGIGGGTNVTVNGNVNNSYLLTTDYEVGGGGNTLNVTGTFTNSDAFYVYGPGDQATVNELDNSGTVLVYQGTLTSNTILSNTGTVELYNTLTLNGAGTSSNSGTVNLYGGTLAGSNASANFNNTGLIQTLGGPSAPSTLNFAGTFTNAIGGTVNLNYSGDQATMATLANGGVVIVASGALLGVGTGTFTAGGGFQLLANGTLNEMLQSTSASGFGVLNITGPVSLAGQLNITLLNGFNPSGDTFDILNYTGSLSGPGFSNGTTFSEDGFDWTLSYGAGFVQLSAGVVPGLVAATWSTGSTNWTNVGAWSCNPSYSPCVPNNNNLTAFTATIDSPGNTLSLDGTSSTTNINVNSLSLVAGTLDIGSGETLNLVTQPGGITDVPSGAGLVVAGTFTTGGTTSALAGLTSVEGYLDVANGQTTAATPSGGTLSVSGSGDLRVDSGSTLTVTGNLTNSGYVFTGVGTTGNTLNVSGTFTNNAGAQAYIGYSGGTGDVANVSALTNDGYLQIGSGATMNITGGGQGITDAVAGSSLYLLGSLNVINGGTPTSGLGNLTSVEGYVELDNAQVTSTTPNGGTLTIANTGDLRVNFGSTLNVSGNLSNSGDVYTAVGGGSGNTLTVTGALTNNANALTYIGYSNTSDTANVDSLTNNGELVIGPNATFNITGGGQGVTDVVAGSTLFVDGTFELGGNPSQSALGNLTSVEGNLALQNGQTASVTPNGGTLTIASGGYLQANLGSTISVTGNIANSGIIYTGNGGSGDTLSVSGTLTNNASGQTYIGLDNATGDVANVNALTNDGLLQIGTGATLNVAGSTDTNSGNVTLYGGTLSSPSAGGNFDNTGTVQTYAGGPAGAIAIGGTFTNEAGANLTLNNGGDVAKIANLANGGTVSVAAGALLGVGTGTFNIPRGYQQLANGTLTEIIGSASSFGVLNITGGISLAGALDITLANSFNPSGDTFDILNYTPGELTGGFSNGTSFSLDGYNWTLTYGSGFVDLTAGAIPSLVAATWSTNSGNWTNTAEWSCNPSYSPCMPNNSGTTAFTAAIDSPGQTLTLDIASNPRSISINNLSLVAGNLEIGSGATLNLMSQPAGITDIPSGAALDVAGTFTAGANSALANLGSVEGTLTLEGQTLTATPGTSPFSNSGTMNLQQGTALTISGDLTNSGTIYTGNGASDTGNNSLTVSGMLTNSGNLLMEAAGDSLKADLTNSGDIQLLNNNQTLTDTGDFNNSGPYGSLELVGDSDKVTVGGNLTNTGNVELLGTNGSIVVTGALSNSGFIQVGTASGVGGGNKLTTGTWSNLDGSGKLTGGGDYAIGGVFQYATPANGITNIGSGVTIDLFGPSGLITPDGTTDALAGLITNVGTLEFDNHNEAMMPSGGTLTNSGTLYVANGSAVSISGTLSNSGTVQLFGTGSSLTADLDNSGFMSLSGNGNTLADTGDFNNNSGGSLNLNADSDQVTVAGNFNNNGGASVAMNGTDGSISVTGTLTNDGVISLGGSNNGASAQTFTNNGTITLTGTQDLVGGTSFSNNSGGTVNIGGTFSGILASVVGNAGTITVTGSSGGVADFSDLNNSGAITVGGSGNVVNAFGTINNSGAMTLDGIGNSIGALAFSNTGNVSVGAGNTATITGNYTQSGAGANLKVNGTLAAAIAFINGGTVSGSGFINADVQNIGGNVIPIDPAAPSTLKVATYTQSSTGMLTIDINGLNSLSLLDVLGAGSLDGNVTFDFGFTPSAGETFTFLTAEAGNLSGVFASDTFNGFGCATCTLDYNYGNGSVTLDINGTAPTPEPSAWLMLGTALLAMLAYGMMQRRSAKRA
ncbi:MAG TPA: hypothetical protein VKM93_05860 [Terriglobia bacterium]|nr:hypothetical protein [Terriglobia bacterium]